MGDTLKHWGVLGMRWGVRNEKPKIARTPSADHTKMQELRKKRLSEMSNAEIQHITNRMNLAKNYKALTPTKASRGKKAAQNALKLMGAFTLAVVTIKEAAKSGKVVYDWAIKAMGDKAAQYAARSAEIAAEAAKLANS